MTTAAKPRTLVDPEGWVRTRRACYLADLGMQADANPEARKAAILLARQDPVVFCHLVMRHTGSGARVEIQPYHANLIRRLTRTPGPEVPEVDPRQRKVVTGATGTGKSQIAIPCKMWQFGRALLEGKPPRRVVFGSGVDAIATNMALQAAGYISGDSITSRLYREIFPGIAPGSEWGKKVGYRIKFNGKEMHRNDPDIRSFGVKTDITSWRIDDAVFDDLVTQVNTLTQYLRDTVLEKLDVTIEGRLEPDVELWLLTNAHDETDASGVCVLKRTEVYEHIVMPVATGEPAEWAAYAFRQGDKTGEAPPGELQWPDRHDLRYICEKIRNTGSWRRLLFCVRRSQSEGNRFARAIEMALSLGKELRLVDRLAKVPPGAYTAEGVDIASGEGKGADSNAFVALLREASGLIRPLGIETDSPERRWQPDEFFERLADHRRRYHCVHYVEDNGIQKWIVKMASKNHNLDVRAHHTDAQNKWDEDEGVEGLAAKMANGVLALPCGEDPDVYPGGIHPEIANLIDEMRDFDPYTKRRHTGDRLMACVVPGHMVTTARGLVPIQDVATGDMVLTHRGRFRRVTGVTVREHTGDVVRLKAAGHSQLVLTPEHPVWRALPRTHTADGTNHLRPDGATWGFVPTETLRRGRKMAGDWLWSPVPGSWPGMAPSRIDLAQYIGTRRQAWGGRWHVDADRLRWRNETKVPRWLDLDEDMCLLIGIYLAEGFTRGARGGHQVCFAFHEAETHLLDHVARIMSERFGASSFIERRGTRCATVCSSSAIAARLFRQFGHHAHEKALPWSWLGLPLSALLAVVRGWLMGDGNVTHLSGGSTGLRGASTSRQLLEQVRFILRRAGMTPSIRAHQKAGPRPFAGKPGRCRNSWILSLSSLDSTRLLAGGALVERGHWHALAGVAQRARTNTMSLAQPGGTALRIASLERMPYRGPVHNMHVEEDESFVVEGIAVHNCWIGVFGIVNWGAGRSGSGVATPESVLQDALTEAREAEERRKAGDPAPAVPASSGSARVATCDGEGGIVDPLQALQEALGIGR